MRAAVGLIAESRRRVRYVPVSEFVAELVAAGMAPIDAESFADVIEPLSGGTDAYLSAAEGGWVE